MENPLRSHYQEELPEAGCDEAGRGCYAGPVFAAAVILPPEFFHPLLNDSKQVTPENRTALRGFIQTHALAWMSYLVPLGLIFILMVIFMPQGLLGFARRWLNR